MTLREHEYSARGYAARAQECTVLANQARDEMIQMELLKLRQTFLKIARRLQDPHQA
jgi:hypothetical protein